jgi:hypothetical protein
VRDRCLAAYCGPVACVCARARAVRRAENYCVYLYIQQHTDGLHDNSSNKMILDYFIVNMTILKF